MSDISVLQLKFDFYDQFECTGSECLETCCGGWRIAFDPETVEKYRTLPGEFGEKVRSSLIEKDGVTYVNLKNLKCPLLTEDGLCQVYINLGPENMSKICQSFPRESWFFGNIAYYGLSIGCSEVARLLFTHKKPLSFCVNEINHPQIISDCNWSLFNTLFNSFDVSVDLLQMRDIPLNKRLQLLVLFADELQGKLNAHEDCDNTIRTFSDKNALNLLLASLSQFHSNSQSIGQLFLAFYEKQDSLKELFTIYPYLKTCAGELASMQETDEHLFAEFINRQEYSLIFENYCVYFLAHHYMRSYCNSDPQIYIYAMIYLCILYACFMGIFHPGKSLSLDETTLIFSRFARIMEHSDEHCCLYQLADILKEQQLDSLPALLSILA